MTSLLQRTTATSEADAASPRAGDGSLVRVAGSRWVRFGLPVLAVTCALGAFVALDFPAVSSWYASRAQHALAAQLDDPTFAGQVAKGVVGDGQALGRLTIPAIGLHMVMVQGVDAAALAKGPGHYPSTPMPCASGNAAVAGHRTTFLHPFYSLNALHAGDVIDVSTPAASCSYVVTGAPVAVSPKDTAVLANVLGQSVLTLTTCTPIGSAAQRLVVRAVMVPSSLRPAPSSVTGNAA